MRSPSEMASCQRVEGCMAEKMSPCVSVPARQQFGITGAALHRSTHALSSATGSKEATMPMSGVIHRMAVAVRRYVADERHVERGLPAQHGGDVLRNLALHHGAGLSVVGRYRVAVARADAASAAHALLGVDGRHPPSP